MTEAVPDGPRLSAVVMTHPDRIDHARALVRAHPELGLRVVVDPDPAGPPTALRTARLAWSAVAAGATHHLVIQDDVTLCPDFLPHLLAAVRSRPEGALSFFTHWGSHLSYAVRLAALEDLSWTEAVGTYLPTVALLMPAQAAAVVAAGIGEAGTRHDDVAVRRVLGANGVPAYVSVRGLVQERGLPSLVGHGGHGLRHNVCFPPPGAPAAWGSAALRPSLLPYFDAADGRIRACRWDEADRMRGRRTDLAAELTDSGFPPELLHDSLRSHLARRDVRTGLEPALDRTTLHRLWSVAHLLGAVTSGPLRDLGPEAEAALDTLGMGALRLRVPMERLNVLRPALSDLVRAGVRAGSGARADAGGAAVS
ncbi:hypothetical protein [Streptomyces griseus]|uniref:hypothetical protein n=2 Tax=Streptomyces TaxID=1883 RepID=UPI00386DDFDA|nr:hypothetical protein OH763_25295 [Streptomyces griseus]